MAEKFILHDFRDLKRCNINFSMDADATVAIDDVPRASAWMDGWMGLDVWDAIGAGPGAAQRVERASERTTGARNDVRRRRDRESSRSGGGRDERDDANASARRSRGKGRRCSSADDDADDADDGGETKG